MKSNNKKTELREHMKNLIKKTLESKSNEHLIQTFESQTKKHLFSFTLLDRCTNLLAYYPMRYEAPCIDIIVNAQNQNISTSLPKIIDDSILFFNCANVKDTKSFTKNSYGIYEPIGSNGINFETILERANTLIIVLVPGLAFSKTGKRLGRGKGYYDRFLLSLLNVKKDNKTMSDLIFVGYCFSFQIIDDIPTDTYDIKMDYVLSEKGIIPCT